MITVFEEVDYREQVDGWSFVEDSGSLYRWEKEDRYSVEILEEEDSYSVDFQDEDEICSALMYEWSFDGLEDAFFYALDFMEFDELHEPTSTVAELF